MELANRVIVVTGAGRGIGRAICRRIAAERPRQIVVTDLDLDAAQTVAGEVDGRGIACDVSNVVAVNELVSDVTRESGQIDVFVSNAGVTAKGGVELPEEDWQRCWDVNVMAHVYAARAILPQMRERGEGYLVQVASAAGLLTEMGSAPYSATKHAAVALAEWLAIHNQPAGVRVSCVCPAGVDTGFLNPDDVYDQFLRRSAVTPEVVAEAVVAGIRDEQFLILPHPEVAEFFQAKSQDYDGWIKNFAHLNSRMERLAARQDQRRGTDDKTTDRDTEAS